MLKNRFEAYGSKILVQRTQEQWPAYYVGTDGKLRTVTDVVIPTSVEEADLEQYLADLFHECATKERPEVRRLG